MPLLYNLVEKIKPFFQKPIIKNITLKNPNYAYLINTKTLAIFAFFIDLCAKIIAIIFYN